MRILGPLKVNKLECLIFERRVNACELNVRFLRTLESSGT